MKKNSLACGIVSIVMALISFFILGFLSISGLIVAIGGLIVEISNRKNYQKSASGLATCIIGLALSAVMMVLYFMALSKIAAAA